LDEEMHPQAAGEVRNSRQASAVRTAADAVRILMKTSTQLSRCCWVKKTNLRATEQSEKFRVRRGIHRSSFSRIIHKGKGALNSCEWAVFYVPSLNSWLNRTACTRYFRYAVWKTLTW